MDVCLGIESTAHTFGVGIVKGKKVLANVKDSYSTERGGIVPVEAAKHHERVYKNVIDSALEKADVGLKDISLVSYSPSNHLYSLHAFLHFLHLKNFVSASSLPLVCEVQK